MQHLSCALRLPLWLALLILPLISAAQEKKHNNALFTYLIHDAFAEELIEGDLVQVDGTIFLKLDEVTTFDNAYKFMDALEGRLMDSFDTERGLGMLGGVPVLKLRASNESDGNTFVRDYFIWDSGKKVYALSISGYAGDARIVEERFAVTRDSFTFTKTREMIGPYYMDVPKIMFVDSYLIWTRIHRPDEWLEVAPRFYTTEDQSAEKGVAEWRKIFKKEKYTNITDTTFTVNDLQVTRMTGNYIKKLAKTTEPESTIVYVLSNSPSSHTLISVSTSPELAPMVQVTLDQMISTASTKRF